MYNTHNCNLHDMLALLLRFLFVATNYEIVWFLVQ